MRLLANRRKNLSCDLPIIPTLHDWKKSIAEDVPVASRLALLISSSIAVFLDTFRTADKT